MVEEASDFTLKVTEYEMVKINGSTEMNFKDFICWIEKDIKECGIDFLVEGNTTKLKLIYAREVYQLDDNNFKIVIDGNNVYYIDTKDKPYLTENLYRLSQITKQNNHEFESYNKVYNGEEYSSQDIASSMKYLKIHKKLCYSQIIHALVSFTKCLIPLFLIQQSFSFLGSLDRYAVFDFILPITVVDTGLLIGTIFGVNELKQNFDLKFLKIILKEIKVLSIKEKQLGEEKQYDLDFQINLENEKANKEDPFDKAIEGYIRNIIKASEKLNREDASNILYKLRKIVSEYKTKCNQKPKEEGLNLEGDYKRKIAREVLDQINELESEVSILLEKQKYLTFDGNDELLQEIDARLASIQEENIQNSSDEQKVSSLSMKM